MFILNHRTKRMWDNRRFKHYLNRKLNIKLENKKLYLKYLFNQKRISFFNKVCLYIKYNYFYKKNIGCSLVKNMCVLTGRGKSIVRWLKMSRHQFKEYCSFSKVCGISKSSW